MRDAPPPSRRTRLRTSLRAAPTRLKDHSPSAPGFWRSPLRGTWFTAVLGTVLLFGMTLLFVTGLLSYAAYNPGLAPVNDKTPDKGLLGFYLFAWPTDPHWLYRLTQGLHVTVGITLIPVLLAKLWSVLPKLFALPPARSLGHALERLSLLLLVGGALFVFATGVLNVQLEYVFPGSFYPLHFYGAWVFFAAFVAHAALKLPQTVRVLRAGGLRERLRTHEGHGPDDEGEDGLAAPRPAEPTVSRRGALGLVGGGSLLLFATTAGQSFDGWPRATALFAPHGGAEPGRGPGAFQVNKTARSVGVGPDRTGDSWRLVVAGPGRTLRLTRADLLGLAQHVRIRPPVEHLDRPVLLQHRRRRDADRHVRRVAPGESTPLPRTWDGPMETGDASAYADRTVASFEGRSQFMTWAYTVAVRQLMRLLAWSGQRAAAIEQFVRFQAPFLYSPELLDDGDRFERAVLNGRVGSLLEVGVEHGPGHLVPAGIRPEHGVAVSVVAQLTSLVRGDPHAVCEAWSPSSSCSAPTARSRSPRCPGCYRPALARVPPLRSPLPPNPSPK